LFSGSKIVAVDGEALEGRYAIVKRLNMIAKRRPEFDTSGARPTVVVFTFEEPAEPDDNEKEREKDKEKEKEKEELPLPEGWEEKTSRSSGDKYWVHLTGESTWERPTEQKSSKDAEEYEVFDEHGSGGAGCGGKAPAVFGFCTVFAPFV
jgi:hypothetical protein